MEALSSVLEWVQNLAFLLVALWAFRRWRRTGTSHSGWLAATFGVLAGIVLTDQVTPYLGMETLPPPYDRALLVGLAVFPYLLLRFLDSFEPVPGWFLRAAGVATGVAGLLGVLLNLDADRGMTPAFAALLLAFTAAWVGVLPVVSYRFWRAGRGQPTLVRRRLRTLAVAAGAIGLALLIIIGDTATNAGAGAAATDEATVLDLVVQLVGLLSALSFLIGLAPPGPLKSSWRQFEEHELHRASVRLMAATTPQQVTDLLVPHVRDVVAAQGAALVHRGEVMAHAGVDEVELGELRAGTAVTTAYPLSTGALHVWTNSYTPFFGEDELELLERLAVLTDLALARTTLLASEQAARIELEAANAELESFVYSASHDLKSPLIAIQSYLDVLTEETASTLGEDATFYVERMRSNAQYMESLVGDLLELSRVGRVETAPEAIDLAELLGDVTTQVGDRYPQLQVHVGQLPALWMNPLRCRQLFRNLLENAASHGGEAGLQVWVESRPADDAPGGTVVLVRDDGEGIPEEYRERVFGVFERLRADGPSGSTGIGLAICKKIAETVGGRIWVTDHDGGAEFAILFPPAALGAGTDTGVIADGDGPATTEKEVPA